MSRRCGGYRGFSAATRRTENGPAVIDHPPKDDKGYVTFGCFNNYTKLTDPVLALVGADYGEVA